MRRNALFAFVVAFASVILGNVGAAHAQCALPYTLANGAIADATQVMADFNAIIACLTAQGPAGSTNSVQYNAGSNVFGGVGPLTNGQVVIGSTGAAPQTAALTAGAGIVISNGPGSISISTTGGSGAAGLYYQVLSAKPTSSGTGLTTWLNQGSANVSDSAVGICINAPSSGSGNLIGRYMSAPSTPYTFTALVALTSNSSSYSGVGLGWYDGGSKLHTMSYTTNGGGTPILTVDKWNSPTSYNARDFSSNNNGFAQPIWLQIADNGTSVSFSFSQDGANFLQIFSVAKSSGFLGASGYSNVIFWANPQGGQTLATLMSWTQS